MTPRFVCACIVLTAAGACAGAPLVVSGISVVRGGADLPSSLGACLPRALASSPGTQDRGRVTVESARYRGGEDEGSRYEVVQRHVVRLFQSQYEPGPRFLDALVTEYACDASRVRLELVVALQGGGESADGKAMARRLDSLVTHLVTTCEARPTRVSGAAQTSGLGDPCRGRN